MTTQRKTIRHQEEARREEEITVHLVLRARGSMQPHKANGREDIIVIEMLKELPSESIYEITTWFQR